MAPEVRPIGKSFAKHGGDFVDCKCFCLLSFFP